jgi:hypothetical protein
METVECLADVALSVLTCSSERYYLSLKFFATYNFLLFVANGLHEMPTDGISKTYNLLVPVSYRYILLVALKM